MREIKIGKEESSRITVAFSYNPAHIAKIKNINGYRWHPKEKYWSFPYSKDILENILTLFAGEEIHIDPALQASISPARETQTLGWIEITEVVVKELKLKGYSQKTRKAYLHHIERFIRYFLKDPRQLDESHIREYILHLIDKEKVSRAYHDQAVSAIKFLYDRVLNMPKMVGNLPRPKKE
ncbi:MAG: site-specific integrase [Candidatus Aminicenantia bacterium]